MSRRDALTQAYTAARYTVLVRGRRHAATIGRSCPSLDAALRRCGCRSHWCLLTPCNPHSRRLATQSNAQRLHLLQQLVRRHGWRALPARNASPDGRWIEPGLCLLDAPPRQVERLARRFGQLAWVFGRLGAAPRLLWTNDPRS
ncbi:DUF3293 domain-containing protein [Sinimarinibacterium thermocellulolyticum]|uniref:DUF3293 domain-containing protein n=1 Tax=Sinimarinibacterium thermocellulolyticum TaxID=3170016 RepID=A0ABV2ABL1_9GAMM